LLPPAVGPDGTLYAIEFLFGGLDYQGEEIWDKHVIVINGSNGQLIRRVPLAREVRDYVTTAHGVTLATGFVCHNSREESAPHTVGPIVGADGRGYLLVRKFTRYGTGDDCTDPGFPHIRTTENGLDLIELSAAEGPTVRNIYAEQCGGGAWGLCDYLVEGRQVIPDGLKGLVVLWTRATSIVNGSQYVTQTTATRWDADRVRVDTTVPLDFRIDVAGENELVFTGPVARDVTSFAPRWTAPFALMPYFTSANGATYFDSSAQMLHVVENGVLERSAAVSSSNGTYFRGNWIAHNANDVTNIVVADRIADSSSYVDPTGNVHLQRAQQEQCAICHRDYRRPVGKGTVGAGDTRKILTVAIDSSWDDAPGTTNVRIWDAVAKGMTKWNVARDAENRPIQY
jgi:hypothetical protein